MLISIGHTLFGRKKSFDLLLVSGKRDDLHVPIIRSSRTAFRLVQCPRNRWSENGRAAQAAHRATVAETRFAPRVLQVLQAIEKMTCPVISWKLH